MSLYGIDPEADYEFIPFEWRVATEDNTIKAKDGAPVILLGPMDERLSLRIWDARVAYSKKKTDDAPFDPDLRFAVLAATVKGWRGVKRSADGPELKATGTWEEDAKILPASWKDQIFWTILSENAFTEEAVQGFTSRPDSPPA